MKNQVSKSVRKSAIRFAVLVKQLVSVDGNLDRWEERYRKTWGRRKVDELLGAAQNVLDLVARHLVAGRKQSDALEASRWTGEIDRPWSFGDNANLNALIDLRSAFAAFVNKARERFDVDPFDETFAADDENRLFNYVKTYALRSLEIAFNTRKKWLESRGFNAEESLFEVLDSSNEEAAALEEADAVEEVAAIEPESISFGRDIAAASKRFADDVLMEQTINNARKIVGCAVAARQQTRKVERALTLGDYENALEAYNELVDFYNREEIEVASHALRYSDEAVAALASVVNNFEERLTWVHLEYFEEYKKLDALEKALDALEVAAPVEEVAAPVEEVAAPVEEVAAAVSLQAVLDAGRRVDGPAAVPAYGAPLDAFAKSVKSIIISSALGRFSKVIDRLQSSKTSAELTAAVLETCREVQSFDNWEDYPETSIIDDAAERFAAELQAPCDDAEKFPRLQTIAEKIAAAFSSFAIKALAAA